MTISVEIRTPHGGTVRPLEQVEPGVVEMSPQTFCSFYDSMHQNEKGVVLHNCKCVGEWRAFNATTKEPLTIQITIR